VAEEDKLKELEKALAQELDQKVNLGPTNDPRLTGSVQMNPTQLNTSRPEEASQMVSAPPPPSPPSISVTGNAGSTGVGDKAKTSGGQAEELSLDAIDSLLGDIDEDFKKNLNQVSQELAAVAPTIELKSSLALDKDYLPAAEGKEPQFVVAEPKKSEAPGGPKTKRPFSPLLKALAGMVKATLLVIPSILVSLPHEIKRLPKVGFKQGLKDFGVVVKVPLALWKVALKALIRAAQELVKYLLDTSWKVKLKLLMIVILALLTYWLLQHIALRYKMDQQKENWLGSFAEVTDTFVPLTEEADNEEINSPIKHPEYVVQIQTVVASLKATDPKKNPMGRVELYLEGSNQDVATEIKDRELEIRDMVARELEQMTFEELESAAGKQRFKIHVRKEVNKVLNRGRVQRIFFKYFVVHSGV